MYFIRSETANNSTLGTAVSSLPCTSKNKRTVASAKSAYKSAERAGATNCHSFLLCRHKFSIFPFPLAVGFTRRHYLARWTQQWQWQKIEILTIFPVRHGDRHKGTPKTTRGNTRCSTDAGVCIGVCRGCLLGRFLSSHDFNKQRAQSFLCFAARVQPAVPVALSVWNGNPTPLVISGQAPSTRHSPSNLLFHSRTIYADYEDPSH